jgi:predicted nucleic acid-binding protein
MIWNDATRRETERIMRKIPPLRGFPIDELFRPENRFEGVTHPEQFAGVPDPDDRKFAALAHAAGAILISNDAHLLQYRGHPELKVLSAGAFWRRYRDAGQNPDEAGGGE